MEETQLVMLGSLQEIKNALTTPDCRFELFKNHKRLADLACDKTKDNINRVTPVFVVTILEWIKVEDLSNTINERDIEDAKNVILSTRKARL